MTQLNTSKIPERCEWFINQLPVWIIPHVRTWYIQMLEEKEEEDLHLLNTEDFFRELSEHQHYGQTLDVIIASAWAQRAFLQGRLGQGLQSLAFVSDIGSEKIAEEILGIAA